MARERENKRSSPCMDMDRLSSLPDEVICQILSFLPRTKPSVQTSVLSKRWRFLWTFVPFLRFYCDDTERTDIITNIVLRHHKHGIHTFNIAIGNYDDEFVEEFYPWIVNITTTRNICKLVIEVRGHGVELKLPQCLFTCTTLVDLMLDTCGHIPMSGIYFPALKKLKLFSVRFKSHESLAHLISGCPVLEELSFVRVILGFHCCVSSPTLTKFELLLDNNDSSFAVNLDTPRLRYLRLYSFMRFELSVGALDSLIEANIYSRNVLALVGKLYNAKILSLMDATPVINESAFFASDIKFQKLTKLKLSAAHLGFIPFFLGNASNLRVLEFRNFDTKGHIYNVNEYGWKEPEQVPACLLSCLQTVELVLYCRGSFDYLFEMVMYILVNAKVLKMIKVQNPWIPEKKLEAFKRVVKLCERGSQQCKLEFN